MGMMEDEDGSMTGMIPGFIGMRRGVGHACGEQTDPQFIELDLAGV